MQNRNCECIFHAPLAAKIRGGMAEIGERDTGEAEAEERHGEDADQKGQTPADPEEGAGRDTSRH